MADNKRNTEGKLQGSQQKSEQDKQPGQAAKTNRPEGSQVQGEGDYEAGRNYDEKTRQYVETHDVERAARDAKPAGADEARQLKQAEEKGKSRAKEEDRLLDQPDAIPPAERGNSRN